MYAYFKGLVGEVAENYAAIECGGIGYQVFCTTRFLDRAQVGQEVTIYTHLVVREDELSLYGFADLQEKAMFVRLIGISGIGPKAGMAILSFLTHQEVASAVFAGDTATFARVNGIGKKTAERIVLELKDKLDVSTALGNAAAATSGAPATAAEEAAGALEALGYSRQEAVLAVQAVSALADTTEDLVLLALRRMSS